MNSIQLRHGDCIDVLKTIASQSIDLVLTDPPYNIGVQTTRNGKKTTNKWDTGFVDENGNSNYIDWCIAWLIECQRVLKPNGVLYLWHNDIVQVTELLAEIRKRTDFVFVSFCIWDKGKSYRAQSWVNRDPNGRTAPRSWFNICEYCLHFFLAPKNADSTWKRAGLERISNSPECYKPLKDWYRKEKERLGLSDGDIARKYTEATGKKPHMLRHYFADKQFAIPTKAVWDAVYRPLGFSRPSEDLRDAYEDMRADYETMRAEYKNLRNYHRCDEMHCNIWHHPSVPVTGRLHTCQKPVDLLARIIRVSCREGGTVLDCFMGSGSTAVAALQEGRDFIGIDNDPNWVEVTRKRIAEANQSIKSAERRIPNEILEMAERHRRKSSHPVHRRTD